MASLPREWGGGPSVLLAALPAASATRPPIAAPARPAQVSVPLGPPARRRGVCDPSSQASALRSPEALVCSPVSEAPA